MRRIDGVVKRMEREEHVKAGRDHVQSDQRRRQRARHAAHVRAARERSKVRHRHRHDSNQPWRHHQPNAKKEAVLGFVRGMYYADAISSKDKSGI